MIKKENINFQFCNDRGFCCLMIFFFSFFFRCLMTVSLFYFFLFFFFVVAFLRLDSRWGLIINNICWGRLDGSILL